MRAALLIDWDNFVGALHKKRYIADRKGNRITDILEAIIEQARDRAAAEGARLDHKSVFLPPGTADVAAQHAFSSSEIRVYITPDKPQGADVNLVLEASELVGDSYAVLFIVAGDIDYVDPAKRWGERGVKCFLWAINTGDVSHQVRGWRFFHYLDELLALRPAPPAAASTSDLFILCCQSLIDSGFHLQGYKAAIERLTQTTLLGTQIDVGQLWDDAVAKGRLIGNPPPERRPRYESPHVARLLHSVDVVLDEVVRADARHKACDRGRAVMLAAPITGDPTATSSVIDLMVRAGYVTSAADGGLLLGSGQYRWGSIRLIQRVALIVWGRCLAEGWDHIDGAGRLASRWLDHRQRVKGRPWKTLSQTEASEVKNEFGKMLDRAVAARAVRAEQDPVKRGLKRYSLNTQHPLVREMQDTVTSTIAAIKSLSTASNNGSPHGWVEEQDVRSTLTARAEGHPSLWVQVESDHRYWLDALIKEWHLDAKQGRIKVMPKSPLR